jgi:hypothetical protein
MQLRVACSLDSKKVEEILDRRKKLRGRDEEAISFFRHLVEEDEYEKLRMLG